MDDDPSSVPASPISSIGTEDIEPVDELKLPGSASGGLRGSRFGDQLDITDATVSLDEGDYDEDGDQNDLPVTGRAPDGKTFSLPATSNVVTNLLLSSPLSYTFFERIILIPLLFQLYLFFVVRSNRVTFLCLFVFWRITYNLGLGLLLREQSQSRLIVRIVRRMGFGNSSGVKNEWIYFLQKEIQTKMGTTVSFDDMPIEYRAWMLFRGLVDVILVNDFASYVMFAMAYYQPPAASHNGYPRITDFLRLFGGTFLLLFNLWVKMDAHRVVKDYAWYWGDFFFQVEQSLKFDGVFSMAPHPMYSVGYVGFYGASLIVNSYWVFYVSLVAHAAQFAFLYLVENPHIEKAYGSSRRSVDSNAHRNAMDHEIFHKYFRRDLILFKNFDWFRSTDILSVLIPLYSVATALFVGPADNFLAIGYYVSHAVFWRFIYTYVLGAILHFQSTTKFWNRHFIKFGETPREAFQHWKVIYNLSQLMTYLSFLMCAVRLYSWPEDWSYGTILLQHISGTLLIVLHMWTALSVYDVLGDFGWFYGDFFIDELVIRPNRVDGKKTSRYLRDLRYTGIYRFLNNPEKIMGHASFWGLTLITSSKLLFLLTMFGQVSNWAFLHYVERPHMRRLYGNQAVRAESSVSKALRKEVVEKVERVVERVKESLEGVIDVDGRAKREQYESDEGERSDTDDDETVPLRRSLSVPAAMSSQMTGIVGTNHSGLRARRPLRSRTERNVSTSPGRPSSNDEVNELFIEDDNLEGVIGKPRRKTMGNRISVALATGRRVVTAVVEEMEKVVDSAKPTVQALMTRVIKGETIDPFKHLPLEFYTLRLIFNEDQRRKGVPVFVLGEPIVLEFTAPRETIKHNDWIGLYNIAQNHRRDLTTSQSRGRWLFLTSSKRYDEDALPALVVKRVQRKNEKTGPVDLKESSPPDTSPKPEDLSEQSLQQLSNILPSEQQVEVLATGTFGSTYVEILPSSDPGLRIVRGRLTFRGDLLPWTVGLYEARYHYDIKYQVLARSITFEVVADRFEPFFAKRSKRREVDEDEVEADKRAVYDIELNVPNDEGGDTNLLEDKHGATSSESAADTGDTEPSDVGEDLTLDMNGEEIVAAIEKTLLPFVARAIDIEYDIRNETDTVDHTVKNKKTLNSSDDIFDIIIVPDNVSFTKYQEVVSRRIVYAIKQVFGIDFSWKVVDFLRTVHKLAERINEAYLALSAPRSPLLDSTDSENNS